MINLELNFLPFNKNFVIIFEQNFFLFLKTLKSQFQISRTLTVLIFFTIILYFNKCGLQIDCILVQKLLFNK